MTSSVLGRDATHPITIVLNGTERRGHAPPRMLLTDYLRHTLGATGTHVGCEHGVCGACTVQIDGIAQRACMTLAVQVDDRRVDTIEGLAGPDAASRGVLCDLQTAFKRNHALQCGFCTAGILMSCADWLQRMASYGRDPDETAVREMLSGHLCRCTGYTPIVKAVLEVVRARSLVAQESVDA